MKGNITDITYGIPAEVWPRDYGNVERAVLYYRAKKVPISVTTENGQTFSMYVYGMLNARNKLDLTPTPSSNENRVRVPLERVSVIETTKASLVQKDFVGRLTISPEEYQNKPSRRDFFKICRSAYLEGKQLRVYMVDGRVIDGMSSSLDSTHVNIRHPDGKQLVILFDWVDRIIPF